MDEFRKLTTQEKALRINLSKSIYGSFAEIGAGQEVAANFFKVGGASGTVAKTMSAYDMKFSDSIYGSGGRYVSEDRLNRMLDHEYVLLAERLPHRIEDTRFFAFADTVEVLNYERTNQGHGWMGLRFQLTPQSEPNDCIIHMKLHDNDPLQQQYAIGVVGVNLLYGCMFMSDADDILMSLLDGLSTRRIEIDLIRLSGPDFRHVDNRLMALKLVKNGFTKAAMFGPNGDVMQASDELYKRNVLVLRGRFRPPTHVNVDMLLSSRRHFKHEHDVERSKIVLISELTLNDLGSTDGKIDEKDFLHRADILCSLGQNVLISNYFEYYRLVDYLSKITRGKKIGITMGIYALQKVFDEKTYENIRGGILECFASLFGSNVKLYIYPALRADNKVFTLKDFEEELPAHLKPLFRYLMVNNKLEDVSDADIENLHIVSDNVLAMIRKGESGWEKFVPHKVEEAIKSLGLFDYGKTITAS
jgi:hypothetical protein